MKTLLILALLFPLMGGKTPDQKHITEDEIVFDLQKWEDGFIYPGAWRAAVGNVHDVRVDGKWVKCLLLEIRIEYTEAKYDNADRWLKYHLVTYEYKVLGGVR